MRKENPKHREFANKFVETGNATKSVKETFRDKPMSEGYSRVKGHDLLTKPNIIRMIDDAMEGAQNSIIELSQKAKNENVKLNASKDILDRGGLKPVDKSEVKIEGLTALLDTLDGESKTSGEDS